MIPVSYRAGAHALAYQAEDPRTLLTNRQGWYLALGAPNLSNYDGLFVPIGGVHWKTLWNLLPDGPCTGVELDGASLVRRFHEAEQRLALADSGLLVRCRGSCTLTLDCKRRYDESEAERHYAIRIQGAHDANAREDALARVTIAHLRYACPAGTVHMCLASTMPVTRLDRWRAVEYAYDRRRGTQSTPWVYDALRLSGDGELALSVGDDARRCEQAAMSILLRRERLDAVRRARYALPSEIAWRALDSLRTEHGLIAGLPWFSQVWSRDELIAAGGLLAAGEHEEVRAIADRWYAAARPDGTLPAIHPDQGLRSADAPGWLGRRTLDLVAAGAVDASTASRWLPAAERLLRAQVVRDGLVWTGHKETWMDTDPNGDGRAGARVEIQALYLALCDAALALAERAGASPPATQRDAVLAGVRERLLQSGKLLDGIREDGERDERTRPNCFLAWYAYPDLLSAQEWRMAFRQALDQLWLSWGGIASLAPGPGYRAWDTGEDSAAYHHGDAWYFLNNIAALALHSVAPSEFQPQVDALLRASLRDLCGQGFLGCASEVSSAERQEAMGCHAQAWSAATLLEALRRIPHEATFL